MLQWFGISAVNPLLLWGALAVAAPIIIHLLSKRKFRVVDWAAMDFLFDADKRNRRRVRMENFILLMLRCVAMLLVALMLSRLFISPSGMSALGVEASAVERIVLLDDSPSTTTSAGRNTSFDQAKESLLSFVRDLAAQGTGDTFTLVVCSDAERPIITGRHLTGDGVAEIEATIEGLVAADMPANLDTALLAMEDTLRSPGGNVTRAVYLLSDLRRRDWTAANPQDEQRSVTATIKRLADAADSFHLIDIGTDSVENLLITEIGPQEKTLVAGVEATFDVTVLNAGTRDADDVEVAISSEQFPELRRTIENIPAGQTATVPFTLKFGRPGDVRLQANLTVADVLARDNVRYYAGKVLDGVQVLVVDGDPSSDFASSETFFLQRALAPSSLSANADEESADSPGDTFSGNVVEVVAENQFEGLALSKYQLIYLCNLYRLSDERVRALNAWVKSGGGLVISLGEQVDQQNYNDLLFAEGSGLLPARLAELRGDDTKQAWVDFSISAPNHPVLQLFEGIDNALAFIHVFRWWKVTPQPADTSAGRVTILASATDEDASPLILEKSIADGRVLLLTTSIDADWTDWPADDTYPIVLEEIKRYMARRATGENTNLVGTPIQFELDPAKYMIDARVKLPDPEAEPVVVQAVSQVPASAPATDDASATTGDARTFAVRFDSTLQRGLYELELQRRDGGTNRVAYAVNLDPTEGNLQRVDDTELQRLIGSSKVQFDRSRSALSLDVAGARTELWKPVLLLLGGVLCIEQLLGWLFGRRRA